MVQGRNLIRWSPGQFRNTPYPWHRRSAPDLPPRLELIALADTAPANSPVVGAAFAAGEQRGTTFSAEMLKARPAVIARFRVDPGRSPRHPYLFARANHRDPEGRSSQHLAIRAMTDRDTFRVDVGLIGHRTAMALALDIHLVQLRQKPRDRFTQKRNGARRRRFYHLAIGKL
jgi:hypothetical protein